MKNGKILEEITKMARENLNNDLILAMQEKTKKYFKEMLNKQCIVNGYDTEENVNQYNMAFWEDVMACVESKWILQKKSGKIESREVEIACNHVIDNIEKSHFLLRMDELEIEDKIKKDVGSLPGSIVHCLYPFVLFISTNLSLALEGFRNTGNIHVYNLLFFLTFFLGINEEYNGLTLTDAFAKELSRSLKKVNNNNESNKSDESNKNNKNNKNNENNKIDIADINALATQLENGYNSINMRQCAVTLSSGISFFNGNATVKQLERKVESIDVQYLRKLCKISKNKKEVNKGSVLYCVDYLTKWITYYLFTIQRIESEKSEKIKSDGYYTRLTKKKTYDFRRDYFDYSGIALKYLSIKKIPNVSEYVLIEKMTHNFWYETEQLKNEIIKMVLKMDGIKAYSYDIYEKLYDQLASDKVFDLGKKKDLCIFYEMIYDEMK